MRHESGENENRSIPKINKEIAARLGEIGVGEIPKLPRRTKKAFKKAQGQRALTALELARLQSAFSRDDSKKA